MKKKKVVALLLAAAMTTASFMPSTGFFNVTEVQASSIASFPFETSTAVVAVSDSGIHIRTSGAYGTGDANTVTVSALTTTTPAGLKVAAETDEDESTKINIVTTTGSSVTASALVSGSSITSAQSLATSLSSIRLIKQRKDDEPDYTAEVTTGVKTAVSMGAMSTTAAAVSGSVTFNKFGDYDVYFGSGSAVESFGAFKVRVKVPLTKAITVSDAVITTSEASDSTKLEVVSSSIKLKLGDEKIAKKYITGSGLYYYKWYRYKSEATSSSDGAVENFSEADWASVNSTAAVYVPTQSGLYCAEVYYGNESGTASSSAFRVAKYVEIGNSNDDKKAVGVKAGNITKVQKNQYKVYGYYVQKDNKTEAVKPSDSAMKISWYALSSGTVDETSGEALKKLAANPSSGVIALNGVSAPSGSGLTSTVTLPNTLTTSSTLVAVVSASGVATPATYTVKYTSPVAFEPTEPTDTTKYTTGNPYKISASGLRYNESDKNANQIVVLNPGFYGEDGKPVNPSKYNITANAAFDVYTTNYSDYIKVQSYGAVSGSSLIDNIGKTFVKTVSGASIFDDNGNAIIKVESGWSNEYIVIVIRDRAENSKVIPYAAAQENVSYVKAATNTDSRRTTSNTGSGTTGTNGTTGGSTGTNGTSGGSSTGTSTTGTGTTTPTGTTPTTNVVENADGSKTTTTTETKADGSTVETSKTEFKDGSTLEVTTEKKADGTVIETTVETAANGDKATTVYTTSPNGTKSKKVSIVKADGSSETTTITENADGSATIVNETKDASGSTSIAYSLAAGAAGVTVDKIDTTAKKVVIPAKIAIAGGAATLKGVTALKANTLSLEGKTIKVTKVGAAALKGNKTATNLVIGKNIKTIGKQAFMNATKVKTVNFKGNVNTIGKNSFKNINKKATIKIKATAKQFKALKKKIKNKGAAPAKVTYKRVK